MSDFATCFLIEFNLFILFATFANFINTVLNYDLGKFNKSRWQQVYIIKYNYISNFFILTRFNSK